MTCPNCNGGAVVSAPMKGDPGILLHTCTSCSLRWSDRPCEARNCRDRAIQRCVECAQYRCNGHAGGRSGVCAACVRRIGRVVRPTNWSRTTRLHQ